MTGHESQSPAVELSGVRRVYPGARRKPPTVALDGVSLSLARAGWTALLGPNGSGKSTLLRLLATIDTPDSGDLRIMGMNPRTEARRVRADLGVVFQSPGLDPLLTVRENLACHGALFGLGRDDVAARIEREAAAMSIRDRLDDRVGSLSGGLARRADLARALLTDPSLLLIDEPTAGLDHAARAAFLDSLDGRRRRSPLTVVMSTHLLDEAERADRVVMLDGGRIVADGAPSELRARFGGGVLRAAAPCAPTLRELGLDVRTTAGDAVAAGENAAMRRAAESLLLRNIAFAFGPPTLGDVYLAATGRPLQIDAGANAEAPA